MAGHGFDRRNALFTARLLAIRPILSRAQDAQYATDLRRGSLVARTARLRGAWVRIEARHSLFLLQHTMRMVFVREQEHVAELALHYHLIGGWEAVQAISGEDLPQAPERLEHV